MYVFMYTHVHIQTHIKTHLIGDKQKTMAWRIPKKKFETQTRKRGKNVLYCTFKYIYIYIYNAFKAWK